MWIASSHQSFFINTLLSTPRKSNKIPQKSIIISCNSHKSSSQNHKDSSREYCASTMVEIPFLVLMLDILGRLPARAVIRCMSVCTQWKKYLSSEQFARHHCHHMRTSTYLNFLSIAERGGSIHTFGYATSMCWLQNKIELPFKEQDNHLTILASLDGLLCVSLTDTSRMCIWNPTTNIYKTLPTSTYQGFYNKDLDVVGFYVSNSADYQVLHIRNKDDTISACIYSHQLDSWRELKSPTFTPKQSSDTIWTHITPCRESLYFLAVNTKSSHKQTVVRYNTQKETFTELACPQYSHNDDLHTHIASVHNVAHLLVAHGPYNGTIDVWRVHCDTWTKMSTTHNVENTTLLSNAYIRYVDQSDKWVIVTDFGDFWELNTSMQQTCPFYPSKYFSAIKGALYAETLISPTM